MIYDCVSPLALTTSSTSQRICCDLRLPWYRYRNVMKVSLSLFTKSILVCLEVVEIWIKKSNDLYIPWTCRNWEFPQHVTRNFLPWGFRRKLCSQFKILFSFTYSFNKCAASQISLPCFDLADPRKFALYIQKNHCHFHEKSQQKFWLHEV
jgi:hypothetical protein